MILIKLGGSIITNKEKPLSARRKTIDNLTKSLKKIKEPIIIIHGGGSYGHYWSVKYDMHTKERKYDIRGVSIIKNSMIELNKIILDSLLKNKSNPPSTKPNAIETKTTTTVKFATSKRDGHVTRRNSLYMSMIH